MVDVDECQAKHYPCSHDPYVQCINLPGSYHCGFCPPGYTGNGFQCSDLNECDNNNGGCSLVPRVSCLNTRGSRVCGRCPPGYTGDGVFCTPMAGGACAINNGGCHPTAHCYQNAGIVTCRCPDGYVGDGVVGCSSSTLAVHPCHNNPCKNGGTCVSRGSTASCICHPHLTGSDCSVVVYASCIPNPCQNNGICSVSAVQGVSQVRCTCVPGFEGVRCELMSSDCGGMFYQDTGELQVPTANAIQLYTNGKLCSWHIQVSSGKAVHITFSQMIIDSSVNCENNYVRVEEPATSHNSRRFCKDYSGQQIPEFTSASNVVIVKFFSTSGVHSNRFKLTWKAVEPTCGGEFTINTHGFIESPMYPKDYPANQYCEWKLLAPPGKKIQFLFNAIDLEPSPDCTKDYLKIQEYDDDEPGNVLAKFCNSSIPVPISTHLPAAYVLFHSDSSGSGTGFRVTYTLLDGCGAVLTSPTGYISPPMSPSNRYLSDQDCEWRIQLPLGDQIKITFNNFDLEERDPCDDFLEVRDGPSASSPVVGQWCGSTLPPPYTSSSNTLTVIFHSDFIISGTGFNIHYETLCGGEFSGRKGEIRSPNYPLPYPAERECAFLIATPPATVVQLHFQDFQLEDLGSDCEFDYLEIHDGANANATLVGRYCGEAKPDDIISSFNYLYLVLNSDATYEYRGFLANYSAIEIPCGGILKENIGVFSAPQNEDGYLPSTQCKWMITAPPGWAVQLSWLSLHLEYSRDCQMDAVEVYENDTATANSTLIAKYCGLQIPPTTTSTTNMLTVVFKSDDSVHREGFTAHYIMIDKRKVCGGTYRSITGTIESPNYPSHYPDNKECIYIIHVAQGQQIKLTFETFNLEALSHSCAYDSLEIRNGLHETSSLVGKYCGNDLPPPVTSITNGLWIHFSSDRSSTEMGFKATWDATITGCGGTLTGPRGTITSPNYPQPYAQFAECFFKISVSQGSRVRLTIVDLDLESHSRCALDYIEMFDGLDDRSKSLGRFCSSGHPSSVFSSSNHMFVKFVSDISYSGHGFHLKYHSECNITLKSHHGVLESPNYPQEYLPDLNCMWLIQAPAGNKLNISFVRFQLEESAQPFATSDKKESDCRYDFLEILEGTKNQTASNVLGRYCGSERPQDLHSQLDQVYIHFVTDHIIEDTGFHLEWVVSGCGGVFREKPMGTFTSPNYPNGYPLELMCEWLIVAPWDKSIQITVNDLHMEDLSRCDYDSLSIYGGEDDTSPILMKACHRQTSPLTFTTSGNHAFVRFISDHSNSGKGFSASWKFVDSKCGGKLTSPFGAFHSNNYPKNYENNDDCEWLIQVPSNHLINLTFVDFDVEPSSSNITTDYVNVYDGKSVNDPILLSHSGNMLPSPAFVISTTNTILVRHKADGSLTAKGFSAHYAITCGARITASGTGTFSLDDTMSASSPWASDTSNNCTWYITAENPADKIQLTFTFLDTSPNSENEDSLCSYNYVAVHDGDDLNATVLTLVCGTKVPPPLRSSGSALTVQAVSLIYSRTHLGRFSALYSTYSTACGGELISEQGAIASLNYPNGYPAGADCEWQLQASVGNRVSLSFIVFDLEQSEYCNTDYVEVRTGSNNGTLQGVFCGSELPNNITASNSLWVRFHSDSINTAKGFMAEYSLVHGNDLVGDSGQIASPLYPRPFVQTGDYKWTITVSNNKLVRITFSNFYMDKYGDDCYIFLQVFDGPDTEGSSPSLLKACGAALPSPVMSTSNIVSVLMKNDPFIHGSYFLMNWQSITRDSPLLEKNTTTTDEESLGCGKKIYLSPASKNNTVTVTSPNYPKVYEPNLVCSWILETSPGYHLELSNLVLDLEVFDDCDTDFVKVFTDSATELTGWSPLSPNLCYPNTSSLILVAGQRMHVYFESDLSEEKTGFSAKITAVCGGLITVPNGKLDTTTLLPNMTTRKINCEWEFRVRSGRTIQFTFHTFNLPKLGGDSCVDSYIMFRNGGHKDSPPLGDGKYCGTTYPLLPKTTSSHAFISYVATPSAPGVVLQFEEVDFACNHDIYLSDRSEEIEISTPNYPQSPTTPHITCTWTITAPPGESVHLHFTNRFDLKPSPGCKVEYLEMHDGGTELSPLIGQYCSNTPTPKVTQGNRMFIKYFTDADAPNNGFTALVKIATCGGTYFDQNVITLTSPQYPSKYPANVDCLWRIVAVSIDYQLKFNISELFLGDDENCDNAKDYLEFLSVDPITKNITDDIELNTKLCGRLTSDFNGTALVPPSSSNEMYIRFHSGPRDSFENKKRFAITITSKHLSCSHEINAPSGVITTPGYPNPIPRRNHFFCSWLITVPEGRVVSLKMVDFDLEPVKASHFAYQLTLYSGHFFFMAVSASTAMLDRTIDSFSNSMMIHSYEEGLTGAHRGFKAEFTSDKPAICGGKLGDSGSVGFTALSLNLTSYFCEWAHTQDPLANNQSTFTISINGTLNVNGSAHCPLYPNTKDSIIVRIQTGKATYDKVIAVVCQSTQTPIMVRSPFPMISIMARKRIAFSRTQVISSPSIANFSISYKTDPCGGIIHGPDAIITSPGFPGQYSSGSDCAWFVQFQAPIRVKFESLDLDADCSKDFVRLYNGGTPLSPHLTAPLCGNNMPPELITQSNVMFIEFHSGGSNPSKGLHKGFKVALTLDLTGCGGVIHSPKGFIQSPNYGSDYPNNTECDWTVILPVGFHASIFFLGRFNLESSANCQNDFIQIFDWRNEKWEQIESNICGRTPPTAIQTKAHQFRVLFRTNSVITSDGFQLSWTNLCGGVIDVTGEGTIISPNYPKLYFGNLNCNYTLMAPGKTIYGSFKDFDVEESASGNRCRFDNVTLTTYFQLPQFLQYAIRWSHRFPLTNTNTILCGSQIPEPVTSYNRLELVFKTDPFLENKGFLFMYTVSSCGGNITSPTVINSPNNTQSNNCTWFVTAPPNKVVLLKVQKLNRFYGLCTTNGLRLYNGHDINNSSNLIETLCSGFYQKNTRYVSFGDKMAIHYFTKSFMPMIFRVAIGFTYGEKHKCGGTIRTADVSLPYTIRAPDVDGDGHYEALLSCDWIILAPEAHQIRVTFNRLDIQNCSINGSSCACDFLEVYDGDNEGRPLIGRFCGSSANPDVFSSTGSLLIHFFSDGAVQLSGFHLTITTSLSPCGLVMRNATSKTQVIESPGYSAHHTTGTQVCLWHVTTPERGYGLLSLRVTDLDLPSPCSHNYLEITQKASTYFIEGRMSVLDSRTVGAPRKLCGNRTADLTFSSMSVQIRYMSNRQSNHRGFKLEYKMKECSGNYTAPFGRLVADQFHENNEDTSCINLIQVPQPNVTISLYFNTFLCFESGRTPGKMVVYDGNSDRAKEIATFCSARRPNPIFSTGPALYFKFHSASRLGKFDISYISTDQGRGCGGRVTDVSGMISSPLYPEPYKKDSSCRWDVSVPHGNKIYFNFLKFDIGETHMCNTNYIQFYDVDTSTGSESLHSRFCGKEMPAQVQMSGDTVFVRYITSIHNNGTGWVLRWSIERDTWFQL